MISFLVSRTAFLETDEKLTYWTARMPSFHEVFRTQLHYPISIDPPVFHLLAHAAMRVLGQTAFACRLPAILSYLLLQIVLFLLVQRVAGRRAGIVAATVVCFSMAFPYGAWGRPYALLLALDASALLLWCLAKDMVKATQRANACIALALVLLLAVHTHFFGFLILLPLAAAELVDTISHRRIDYWSCAALASGSLWCLLLLPFSHAAAPFRANYYAGDVTWRFIPESYQFIVTGYAVEPGKNHLPAIALGFVCLLLIAFTWQIWRAPGKIPIGLWASLVTLSLLPVFGYLVSRWVTHTAEFRYVMPLLISVAVILAVVARPLLTGRVFVVVVGLMLAGQIALSLPRLQAARVSVEGYVSWARWRPEPLRTMPMKVPIYTTDLGIFLLTQAYEADPAVRERLVLLYDRKREVRRLGTDTGGVTAQNLGHFPRFRSVSFEDALRSQRRTYFVAGQFGSWLFAELKTDGYVVTPVGPALGGTVYEAYAPNGPLR